MENQLESDFQGSILQVPRYHLRHVPSALVHTNMPPNKYYEETVIMKIIGVLVDMLVKLDSETHRNHVVFENGNK